jgi:hypothetical protein
MARKLTNEQLAQRTPQQQSKTLKERKTLEDAKRGTCWLLAFRRWCTDAEQGKLKADAALGMILSSLIYDHLTDSCVRRPCRSRQACNSVRELEELASEREREEGCWSTGSLEILDSESSLTRSVGDPDVSTESAGTMKRGSSRSSEKKRRIKRVCRTDSRRAQKILTSSKKCRLSFRRNLPKARLRLARKCQRTVKKVPYDAPPATAMRSTTPMSPRG